MPHPACMRREVKARALFGSGKGDGVGGEHQVVPANAHTEILRAVSPGTRGRGSVVSNCRRRCADMRAFDERP